MYKKLSKLSKIEIIQAIVKTRPNITTKTYNNIIKHILTNMFEQTFMLNGKCSKEFIINKLND